MEVNNTSNKKAYDLKLIDRAIHQNDQNAYDELMSRYRESLYYMILKMVNNREDAEDLTIEAFSKAFLNLEKYTPTYAFSTWLFKIASNNTIDFLRKKRLKTISIDEQIFEENSKETIANIIPTKTLNPAQKVIKEQRADLVQEVIKQINPKYATLIELRYFKELSYDEIAKELNQPLGTIKVQLHRAKQMLKNILEEQKSKF